MPNNGKATPAETPPRRGPGRPPKPPTPTILGGPPAESGDVDARLVAALEELGKKRHRIAEAKAAANPVEAARERYSLMLETAAKTWYAALPDLQPLLPRIASVVEQAEAALRLPFRFRDRAVRVAHAIAKKGRDLHDLIGGADPVKGLEEHGIGKISKPSLRSVDFVRFLDSQIAGLATRAADVRNQYAMLVELMEQLAKEDLDPDAFAAFTLIRPGPEERQERAITE